MLAPAKVAVVVPHASPVALAPRAMQPVDPVTSQADDEGKAVASDISSNPDCLAVAQTLGGYVGVSAAAVKEAMFAIGVHGGSGAIEIPRPASHAGPHEGGALSPTDISR